MTWHIWVAQRETHFNRPLGVSPVDRLRLNCSPNWGNGGIGALSRGVAGDTKVCNPGIFVGFAQLFIVTRTGKIDGHNEQHSGRRVLSTRACGGGLQVTSRRLLGPCKVRCDTSRCSFHEASRRDYSRIHNFRDRSACLREFLYIVSRTPRRWNRDLASK